MILKTEPFNRIEVSKSALLHNFDLLREASQLVLIPVVKSNAYGHGLEQVAEALKERTFPYLAVNNFSEAKRIRMISQQPVLILGALADYEFAEKLDDNFAFYVQDEATLGRFAESGYQVKIHLDIDTGMKRYGIDPDELDKFLNLIKSAANLELEGVASHLADGDGLRVEYTKNQILLFDELVMRIKDQGFKPKLLHIANAPGFAKYKSQTANAFRPGIGVYGINPLQTEDPFYQVMADLKPALKLLSTITKTRQLSKGNHVGYSKTFKADHDMKIGVIPLGYYEGLPRSLSNEGSLKSGGNFLKITGRISMNHTMLDLTGTKLAEGDEVVVISDDKDDSNSIEQMCKDFYFFTYGLLVKLGPAIERILVD